jgi:hypothetical protein
MTFRWQLKCLYVAITRARQRLWIVDYSHACLPIKVRALYTPLLARHEYETQRHLLDLGLVKEPSISRNPLEAFVNQSTSDEWTEAGKRLLSHGEFEQAAVAFSKAGNSYMQAVAEARHSREVARDVPESSTKNRREAFVAAAKAFEHCATMAENEAEHSHYVAASRCYAEVGCHREVVRILKRLKMYTKAASYCFDNNLLQDAVLLIKSYSVDREVSKRIKQVARISYLEAKNLE